MKARKTIRWYPIIEKYEKREITRKEILDKYGCSVANLNQILRYYLVDIWDKDTPIDDYELLLMKYKNREISRDEIVDKLGIEMVNLTSVIRRRGIELWDRKKTKIETIKDKLVRLYNEGKPLREIAKILGISHAGAWQKLYKLGLVTIKKKNKKILEVVEEHYIKNKNEDYDNEFHNPKLDKSPYALIFYKYNE